MEKRSGNAIAIGNFDGFHLGHQSIIENTLKIVSSESLGSVLLTFHPNPKLFFKIEDFLIFSDEQKKKVLGSIGFDKVEYMSFADIYKMDGQDFINKYLLDVFHMKYLIVGENFRLGRGKEWDIHRIIEYGKVKDFNVKVVASENYKEYVNNKVSKELKTIITVNINSL